MLNKLQLRQLNSQSKWRLSHLLSVLFSYFTNLLNEDRSVKTLKYSVLNE